MRRYFARDAESDLGHGVVYMEFDGETATRQVERYGERWFDSRTEYHPEIGPGLVDQPLSALGLGPADEITEEQFEEAWRQSVQSMR